MRFSTWLYPLAALLVLITPAAAQAGAWPQEPGKTQVILSYEAGSADRVFDGNGDKALPLENWRQDDVFLYIDRGITQRLTLTGKINYKSYATDTDSFSGFNSVELGGRFTVYRGDTYVFAVGAGVEAGGDGRRSDFDLSGKQGTDYDLRAYGGRSFKLAGVDAFVNVEAARHLRENEANQWRVDATFGLKPSPKWMVMAQTFSGHTDEAAWGRAMWSNTQVSVVRSFGPENATSLQLAVRKTTRGQNVPAVNAAVLSLWKTF